MGDQWLWFVLDPREANSQINTTTQRQAARKMHKNGRKAMSNTNVSKCTSVYITSDS